MILCTLLTSPALAQDDDCPYESYAEPCNDGDPINGYWWYGFWIPGLPDLDSWFRGWPVWSKGNAVYYAPGVMKATANVRGISLDGTLGGVSALSCSDVGHEVYIRVKSLSVDWEGPYMVVDCGQQNDIFGNIVVRGEVVEVGWDTWQRWGATGWRVEDVEVSKVHPSLLHGRPVHFPSYWGSQVTFSTYAEYENEFVYYRSPSDWKIRGEWVTFYPPTPPPFVPDEDKTPEPKLAPTPLYEYDKHAIVSIEPDEQDPETTISQEETDMKRLWHRNVLPYIVVLVLSLALMAFQVFDEARFTDLLVGVIGFAVMLFGPKPLKLLYDALNIPGGPWRVIATYVVSGVVGFLLLLFMGVFVDIVWDAETILALAGVLASAAQIAYHRLKDLYGASLAPPG